MILTSRSVASSPPHGEGGGVGFWAVKSLMRDQTIGEPLPTRILPVDSVGGFVHL